MFDSTSRYDKIPTATRDVAEPDGTQRLVTYKRRRFVPDPSTLTVLVKHTTAEGERLDTIAAHYLGDPTQFWRICDANRVLRPESLEGRPGTIVDISAAGPA
jgi:hypothetical protein